MTLLIFVDAVFYETNGYNIKSQNQLNQNIRLYWDQIWNCGEALQDRAAVARCVCVRLLEDVFGCRRLMKQRKRLASLIFIYLLFI